MKKIQSIIVLFLGVILFFTSCNEEDLLTEVPKDFLSPENAYVTKAGFESQLFQMYDTWRIWFYGINQNNLEAFNMLGVDLDIVTTKPSGSFDSPYWELQVWNWNTLNADNGLVFSWWSRFYTTINSANVILNRAEDERVKWNSEEEKNAILGEARFFRGLAYRYLANMWGGVPIVLEETTEARYDYTRATREQVYQQAKEDLEFATKWMPTVDQLPDGRAPRAAAYHMLAEVLIQLGDYKGAITAASNVINNPNYELMTERFGVYKDLQFNGYDYQGAYEPWGDVYFDLFQEGNMNRREGNKECIWNIQQDYQAEGGGANSFAMERWCGAVTWSAVDINGKKNFLKDTLMGRPVGTGLPTKYLDTILWEFKGDFNRDIRNSKYNIQREYYWLNPASKFYGQLLTQENTSSVSWGRRYVAPTLKKTTVVKHIGVQTDPFSKQPHDVGRTYKDWYILRLAETYLLRAEAYHMDNQNQLAADDINAVRNRAHATPVDQGEVTIDLILDERARELAYEEHRINTLMRTNKLAEYLTKYHDESVYKGWTIESYKNLFPIPNSEIEANINAVLEQNPGY